MPSDTDKIKISSDKDIFTYNAKDERIFHYTLKKCISAEFDIQIDKVIKTAKGEAYLSLIKKHIHDCKSILLLGEPDYI